MKQKFAETEKIKQRIRDLRALLDTGKIDRDEFERRRRPLKAELARELFH